MAELKVNLTLQQIMGCLCAKCKERVLDLAAKQTDKGSIKDLLRQEFEKKDGK
jgi:hypothetical protein